MLTQVMVWIALGAGVERPAIVAPASPFAESLIVARERAKSGERPLLVNFHTSWCGWCRRMDRETFRDPRVVARAQDEFVFVSLDAEDGSDGSRLAREHRVTSFPTQLVLDHEGRELSRLSGFLAPNRFLDALDRIQTERKKLIDLMAREAASPAEPQLLFDLAGALARVNRRQEAASRYDRLLAAEDTASRRFREVALWSSAALEIELGNGDRAVRRLEALSSEFPASRKADLALYQIGRLHQAEGRREQAIASYKKLLAAFPASRVATAVRLQLELLEAQR